MQNVSCRDFLRVLGWAVVTPIKVLFLERKTRPTHVATSALYGFRMEPDTRNGYEKGKAFPMHPSFLAPLL